MAKYPLDLLTLIASLKKLPGVGRKTAERFAFHLLDWTDDDLKSFSKLLHTFKDKIKPCPECGCLLEKESCLLCDPDKRDTKLLCIIASAKDVYAIEKTHTFYGVYHVLGTLLSPLDGRDPEDLNLEKLTWRIEDLKVEEVVIALDSTLEGDATALFLKKHLQLLELKISRLAFGLPVGSSLDFIDEGTLSQAFRGRRSF